jgi:NAD(P)-dependent dehydrogenase (short-subunit alcohol dehydrogenase family)
MLDLGIKGRRAIVCASSRGLGRACATSLARAGVELVINGLDEARLATTADAIRRETGAKVTSVAADVTTRDGQAKLLAAQADPDILVTNAGGPPFKNFRELARDDLLKGVTWNMVTPIELIQAERRFGRIVNITSISVRMPVQGLDLSSGARWADRVPCRGRSPGRARGRHDQQHPAGLLRYRPLLGRRRGDRQGPGQDARAVRKRTRRHGADGSDRRSGGAWRRLRVPVQRARRLYHRPEFPAGRRPVQQRVLKSPWHCALPLNAAARDGLHRWRGRACAPTGARCPAPHDRLARGRALR